MWHLIRVCISLLSVFRMFLYFSDNRNKKITTTALFPNETSFVTETNRQTGVERVEEGMIKASLNYRLLHGHLKWRPDMLKDITVRIDFI